MKLLAKPTKKKLNNSIISNFNNKKITEKYLKLYKNLCETKLYNLST